MRFESTVSIDRIPAIGSVSFAQTASSNNSVVTRPIANSLGEITLVGETVGTYQGNTPFRFQMDVDLTNRVWYASVDNELNGFFDDPVFSGNQFVNDFSTQPFDITSAFFGAQIGTIPSTGPIVVAHDNIFIGAVPLPPAIWLFAYGLIGLIGIARRKKS